MDKSKFKMFKFKHHKIIRNKFSLFKDFNLFSVCVLISKLEKENL